MNHNARLKQASAEAKALNLTLMRLKGQLYGVSCYAIVPRRRAGLPLTGYERVTLHTAACKLHEMSNRLTLD
jgi:hypothetical protein